MFDATVQAVQLEALEVNEGDQFVTLAVILGITTPIGGPDGRPLILPGGMVRIPMGKDAAQEVINGLQAQVDKLPDPKPQSNIVVPGNPQDVDRLAQDLGRFKS